MARAMGGGPGIENSKDNERSARQAGGRSSGQVLGRPTAQGKDRKVPYRDNRQTLSTDPPRAGHTSSVRLSRGGNRTTGKDPADLPRARGRALFKREWGVNRKASVFVLGFLGLSGSSRSYS
ncbi:hypothetical protein VNO77_46253 [Canavalia gladiata]|uniref:Uncharacterized protein n=1 Tax=Canavalia gladiata TaxID=3824 RepID=A0AAN9JIS3_CANGL